MLRRTRPLLAAVNPAGTSGVGGGVTPQFTRRPLRKPLSERYDIGGLPSPALNPKYAPLLVGQHFGRLVFDRRTEMMAILSATNLIREVIAGSGRILLMSKDQRLEVDLLAAGRDTGEFIHCGKWLPGGFTNRPQVAIVPQLPNLIISFEPTNHVMMREAFQLCIPRVAPVDIRDPRADFHPEVPLHAVEYTLQEKKKMLAFFASFITKLKFGQMPDADTQSRYKEFTNKMQLSYPKLERDIPGPYLKAKLRPHDARPDLLYGVKPSHVTYNEQRAFEESNNYRIGTLQPDSYLDPAATADDKIARDLPPMSTYNIADTFEYSELTRQWAPSIKNEYGEKPPIGPNGEAVPELTPRDYEHEELMADTRARREAGVRTTRQWQGDPAGISEVAVKGRILDRTAKSMPDLDAVEQYEDWLKQKKSLESTFIDPQEPKLSTKFTDPSERVVQERLHRLHNRVKERYAAEAEPKDEPLKFKLPWLKKHKKTTLTPPNTPTRYFSTIAKRYKSTTTAKSSSSSTTSSKPAYNADPSSPTFDPLAAHPATPLPKFRFPPFLYPLFLLIPPFAFYGAWSHASDEDKERIKIQQQGEINHFLISWGFSPIRFATRNPELVEAELQLAKLNQTRQLIYDRIPPNELNQHVLVLAEMDTAKKELEQKIARLKQPTTTATTTSSAHP